MSSNEPKILKSEVKNSSFGSNCTISDIVNIIEKLLPNESSNFTDEIKENIKQAIQDHLHNLDIVTREEFDIQKEVLLKTRLKIEELEKKLKAN